MQCTNTKTQTCYLVHCVTVLLATSLMLYAHKPSLLGATPDTAARLLGGSGRARQVWDVLREGGDPFAEPELLGIKARRALLEGFSPPTHRVVATSVAPCGTTKLLVSLPRRPTRGVAVDNELKTENEVETVIIPQKDFSTLCVSSQVGCRQACSFCATGTMGLLANLRSEDILAQLHVAQAAIREHGLPPLRNVVYMGMGEWSSQLRTPTPTLIQASQLTT